MICQSVIRSGDSDLPSRDRILYLETVILPSRNLETVLSSCDQDLKTMICHTKKEGRKRSISMDEHFTLQYLPTHPHTLNSEPQALLRFLDPLTPE